MYAPMPILLNRILKISELDENGQLSVMKSGRNDNRNPYVDSQMLEQMPWIRGKRIKTVNNLTLVKLESNLSMVSELKLLHALSREQLTFMNLYYRSGIRMKRSFLDYLNFCVELGFIKKLKRTANNQHYMITQKGHELLDMFYVK